MGLFYLVTCMFSQGLHCGHVHAGLQGLERVYFRRVSAPGGALDVPSDVARLLPAVLARPDLSPEGESDTEIEELTGFQDLPLAEGSALLLREVRKFEHPRICGLWWALYVDGERGDVWHFLADPALNEDKLLPNHRMEQILHPDRGTTVFRVFGDMARPDGAWWMRGVEFEFTRKGDLFVLGKVVNRGGRVLRRGFDTPSFTERDLHPPAPRKGNLVTLRFEP